MELFKAIQSFCNSIRTLVGDIFIITRKNLRIRRRRYSAFLLEILIPVVIASFVAASNSRKTLLRVDTLEYTTLGGELETNDTLEGFYDLGNHFDELTILSFTLCSQQTDPPLCQIGYVADDQTKAKIFNSARFKSIFTNTTNFIQFENENHLEDCLKKARECPELVHIYSDFKEDAEHEDPVLGFRGAVIFETGINSPEVKYKIRLMDRHFGSLRHVLKTSSLYPSIYDRQEYALSYLETGFLALQLVIDKMIIEEAKSQSNAPNADAVNFNSNITSNQSCTCEVSMHEIPHRQSDRFTDVDDPHGLSLTDHDFLDHVDQSEGLVTVDKHKAERASKVDKQSLVISTILVLSFTLLIPSEQRRISSEKENGLTILLLVTGMTHRMQWFGNLLAMTISYVLTITVVVVVLTVSFNKNEGAVFEFVSAPVLWLLFFLYVMAISSACYFSTVFFNKPVSAICATLCFWVTTFVAPIYHIDYYYDIVPIYVTLLACLHPSIALQMALRLLIRFEKHRVATSIFALTRIIPTDPLRIIIIVFILILDTIIYMVLAIYLDRILVPRFGITKPWYYIFMLSEYRSSGSKVAPAEMVRKSMEEQPGFEPCPITAEPSITTENLTKKYGKNVAVENINIQLYHGEIFALLGHNGSGKSSILNLFSGFTPPTSGTATIFGCDIRTHMVQIQAFTGMCPQENWLYDDLTPFEHLIIFGRLRGLSGENAKESSIELLEKLHIHEMAHWFTRQLSRGAQRKLSLAIAIIGDPKVLLLDAPTGGLDYYSRRVVWDLLLKVRSRHTIIFTTHFMDEAELLGDRIGILTSGKMQVCGSHAFLRKHFGLGYSLRISMDPERKSDPQEILQLVQSVVPQASLNTLPISPNISRLVTCNLPVEGYSSAVLSKLFIDLARVKEILGIVGFSVSYATIDEVFLELMRRLNPDKEEHIHIENDENYNEENQEEYIKRLYTTKRKMLLPLTHLWVLMTKKMRYMLRNPKLVLFQVVVPFLVYTIGMVRMSSHININVRKYTPLDLTLDAYKKDKITLYYAAQGTFVKPNILKAVIGPSATITHSSDLSGDYIRVDYNELRHKHIVGISAETGSNSEMYVHFSPYALHSAPLALSLFSNTLMKYLHESRRIVTVNHPLPHPYFSGVFFEEDPYAPDIFSMMSVLAASTTVAFCVVFPLQERVTDVKHLQLMAGVHPVIYWLSIFVWDSTIVLIECIFLLSFNFIYEQSQVFSLLHGNGAFFGLSTIVLGFMFSGLMMSYCVAQFARSKSGAFATLMSIILLFGIIFPFFIFGLGHEETEANSGFHWLFLLLPVYALASAQRKFGLTLLGNGRCEHFTEEGSLRYCDSSTSVGTRQVHCCKNCASIPDSKDCYDRAEFVRSPWSTFYHSYDELTNGVSNNNDHKHAATRITSRSVFHEVLYMLLVGLIFAIVTVIVDTDTWKCLISCVMGFRGRAFQTNVEDDDVLDEMDHVERMVDMKKTDQEALVIHNLGKSYGTYPAFHNVSFTVHPGECFGVVGVNGSGKSTLLKLISGAEAQTYGNVYSVDCSLNSKRSQLMRKMGVAPKNEHSHFEFLTCKETIIFYGRLRGLGLKEAKNTCTRVMKKMNLEQLADARIYFLSTGTKLRLGAAVAIVGEPSIVILDTPTSAADPSSRRAYWEIIKEMKVAGHTIIINSQRIQENEEFCHRMAIIVDGKFQCIGSPKHLREKFGSGFKLIVKLIPGPAESQGYVSSLSASIVNTFSPCTLRDRRRNVIQYVIHNANVSWDYLFTMMEHIKLRYTDLVEDYAFSNTTLEEVFLSFVVLQNCGRILDQTGCFCCDL